MKKKILSIGMTRSGSTWLFRLIKHICLSDSDYVNAVWISAYQPQAKGDYTVIKAHGLPQILLRQCEVYSCYRDLRDVISSLCWHKWIAPHPSEIEVQCKEYIEQLAEIEKHARRVFRYEEMMDDKESVALAIAGDLGIQIDASQVITAADKDRQENHPNHTALMGGHHHEKHLTNRQIEAIMRVAGDWLKDRNYTLP